ncbi:hypothetical protein AYM40_11305 [Paraburkholderia phytofirmans OLGA172]|uniref:Twin-arginine translocation signal domain-containing protein n=1 Tax=Paraburkholderia phytofirmans OLGA172 TaxID=1417228 RepID=A0A160FKD9_9BURK|nr:hypothetical protein [Paraburkholderia phytofirmans]ANB72889.1 hypothetical protein AYM40_11305 [Paraburkholderia phytofirmans OLGA172]
MQESKAMKGAMRQRGWAVPRRDFLRGVVGAAALLCAGAGALLPTQGWAESDAVKQLAAPPPIQLPLKPSPEFAKFPRYAGMLGARQIVLLLGAKTGDPADDSAGVHGEYQYTDTGEVILIAGDRDGDTLEVEESNDGTHITGNWVGKFAADGSVAGDRMNVDDSDPQPFDLKPLAAGQAVPAASAGASAAAGKAAAAPQPSAGSAAAPASATSSGHAVGGVSNLQIGE